MAYIFLGLIAVVFAFCLYSLFQRIKDLEEWHDTVLAALQDFDDYDLYE